MGNGGHGLVRLDWEVDPNGYALVDENAAQRYRRRKERKRRNHHDREESARGARGHDQPDIVWPRGSAKDWYAWRPTEHILKDLGREGEWEPNIFRDKRCLIPASGRSRTYKLGLGDKKEGRIAILDLARMPWTPDGVLWFVRHWGLLDSRTARVREYYGASIFIAGAIRAAAKPNGFGEIAKLQKGDGLGLVEMKSGWSSNAKPKPYLFLEATSLYQFMWFDLMHKYNGGADFTCCPAPGCGKFLVRRSGGRSKEHCSDRCRQAARRAKLL
jgi:hypothetical protein